MLCFWLFSIQVCQCSHICLAFNIRNSRNHCWVVLSLKDKYSKYPVVFSNLKIESLIFLQPFWGCMCLKLESMIILSHSILTSFLWWKHARKFDNKEKYDDYNLICSIITLPFFRTRIFAFRLSTSLRFLLVFMRPSLNWSHKTRWWPVYHH